MFYRKQYQTIVTSGVPKRMDFGSEPPPPPLASSILLNLSEYVYQNSDKYFDIFFTDNVKFEKFLVAPLIVTSYNLNLH